MSEVQSPVEASPSPTLSPIKCPSGCVERTLNYRERNLLIGAAREYCAAKERADYKSQSKLDRLSKLISFQETLEYFAMMDDHLEDRVRTWKKEKMTYVAWMDFKATLIKLEDFKLEFPGFDLEKGVPKPSLRQPELSGEEMRGPERVFFFPSKLDAWVQDFLRVATWKATTAEYAVELCGKFGIKDEDA